MKWLTLLIFFTTFAVRAETPNYQQATRDYLQLNDSFFDNRAEDNRGNLNVGGHYGYQGSSQDDAKPRGVAAPDGTNDASRAAARSACAQYKEDDSMKRFQDCYRQQIDIFHGNRASDDAQIGQLPNRPFGPSFNEGHRQ